MAQSVYEHNVLNPKEQIPILSVLTNICIDGQCQDNPSCNFHLAYLQSGHASVIEGFRWHTFWNSRYENQIETFSQV